MLLFDPVHLLLAGIAALAVLVVYRVHLHPLAHVPGPFSAKITPLWLYWASFVGNEASAIDRLHRKYGPVVRIAPGAVDVLDGTALHPVYVRNGGLPKDPCYVNFHVDGFSTLFSELDPAHRAVRAKAVVGMFAPGAIRDAKPTIYGCVNRMVDRIERERDSSIRGGGSSKPVNVLNIARSLALDTVTAYLFDRSYNGIREQELSAAEFVDMFVAVGRFFYLPPWMFLFAERCTAALGSLFSLSDSDASVRAVESFVSGVVDDAIVGADSGSDEKSRRGVEKDPSRTDKSSTYQGRLLAAGISREETIAQCKDLMFAGTDSSGMNLATICWHLARRPEIYARLREEVRANPDADAQQLPYLSCVVKEGLRVSMSNPTRFPRVVPPPQKGGNGNANEGLRIPGLPELPPGTSVGFSIYSLHHNAEVFRDPTAFEPERWLAPTPEMVRDSMPFGLGPRQCIARTLAAAELYWAVQEIARRDALRGARAMGDRIEIIEWFNSKVKGGSIDLAWGG